jgi:hypothetical protein
MMRDGFVAESAHIDELDPAFADLPIVRERRNTELNTVMSNSFGFGGTNGSLILAGTTLTILPTGDDLLLLPQLDGDVLDQQAGSRLAAVSWSGVMPSAWSRTRPGGGPTGRCGPGRGSPACPSERPCRLP